MVRQRLGKQIGRGFQGAVFASSFDDKRVIKQIPLFKQRAQKKINVSDEVMRTIGIMKLASDIGVGPKLYDVFYDTKRENIYVEMEHVSVQDPTEKDAEHIIRLYEKMLKHNFMTFDFEFARRIHGKGEWVIIDFGVTETYPDYQHGVKALVESGLLEDTGIGYYNPKVERHFLQKVSK